MTSCYREFRPNGDYLVYTGGGQSTPTGAAAFVQSAAYSPKKVILEAWKRLGHLPVYTVGGCNPARSIQENDPDLAYLRLANGALPANGWIEGGAFENANGFSWRLHENITAKDAIFTATSRSGQRTTIAVRPDGTFRIAPAAPGAYSISAESALLGRGSCNTKK